MNIDRSIIIFIVGTITFVLFAITLVVFLFIHKRRQYAFLLEKKTMEINYQNQLLQSRMEVQEQSFRYLSEEIHDNIGQLLSIVKMQLHNIKRNSHEEDIVLTATDCTELLGKAIADLRNISHSLSSAYVLNAGLAEAIEKDITYRRSAKKDIKCELHCEGDEYEIGEEQELLIFRIIQEAIGNAMKHAAPTAVDVFLNYNPKQLVVIVKDDGKGFDTSETRKSGIGLSNIYVRAEVLKANISIESAPGKGTSISLMINRPVVAA